MATKATPNCRNRELYLGSVIYEDRHEKPNVIVSDEDPTEVMKERFNRAAQYRMITVPIIKDNAFGEIV